MKKNFMKLIYGKYFCNIIYKKNNVAKEKILSDDEIRPSIK